MNECFPMKHNFSNYTKVEHSQSRKCINVMSIGGCPFTHLKVLYPSNVSWCFGSSLKNVLRFYQRPLFVTISISINIIHIQLILLSDSHVIFFFEEKCFYHYKNLKTLVQSRLLYIQQALVILQDLKQINNLNSEFLIQQDKGGFSNYQGIGGITLQSWHLGGLDRRILSYRAAARP